MTRCTSDCAAPGCAELVARGQLACRRHWYELPAPLRSAIRETWRHRSLRAWAANVREARRLWGEPQA